MSVTRLPSWQVGLCLYEDIQSDFMTSMLHPCLPEEGPAGIQALQSADFRKDSISDALIRGPVTPPQPLSYFPLLKRVEQMNELSQAYYLGLSLPCLVTGALEVVLGEGVSCGVLLQGREILPELLQEP